MDKLDKPKKQSSLGESGEKMKVRGEDFSSQESNTFENMSKRKPTAFVDSSRVSDLEPGEQFNSNESNRKESNKEDSNKALLFTFISGASFILSFVASQLYIPVFLGTKIWLGVALSAGGLGLVALAFAVLYGWKVHKKAQANRNN